MSQIEILKEFKTQLLAFFDELIGQFPREGDLVVVRLFLANQLPIKDAMDEFILKITKNNNELRKMVKERNEKFFLEHNIFQSCSKEQTNNFKKLWISGQLDDEDKEVIWKWIEAFIFLADKYTTAINK